MKIAFRTDASLQIGSGHVMRCLTLADRLKAQGADCHFIGRAHQGHLLETIHQHGHTVSGLVSSKLLQNKVDKVTEKTEEEERGRSYETWLESAWQSDAEETKSILMRIQPDWLVVDHYALDFRWEKAISPYCRRLLVIDDLADRSHQCDLLLDQNLGRQAYEYTALVPSHCRLLIGPVFALLRPEFAALRNYSLQRRHVGSPLNELLVTMGGIDQPNATGKILQALKTSSLPQGCRITVVMGLRAPWLENVRDIAEQMPWPTEVVVNVNDMAQRMAASDLAIGAAGGTSWERCCLGLPTLMVIIAENQKTGANALHAVNAARLIGTVSDIAARLPRAIEEFLDSEDLLLLSRAASSIVSGEGVDKVISAMETHDA